MIEVRLVRPSAKALRYQTEHIEDLAKSISAQGLLQPIILRPKDSIFEIVAGHRRFEACKKLRWQAVPAIIKELDDKAAFEISLIENLQRKTLTILEEARAFKRYTEDFGWGGAAELSRTIGRSEAYISHTISLLGLPEEILLKLESGGITRGAAQELVWTDKELQDEIAKSNSSSELTVREMRRLIRDSKKITTSSLDENATGRPSKDAAMFAKAALALKIAMIRLDSIIEKTEGANARNYLMQKRLAVHELIGDILSQKKHIEKTN